MNSNLHELDRSVGTLSQCLSQAKRPLGVLLGAGCPVSIRVKDGDGTKPLIPNIAGLTIAVNEALKSMEDLKGPHAKLTTGLNEDLGRAPNIEDMLSRLRTLATIAGKHSVRELGLDSIQKLEKAITTQITQEVNVELPDTSTPYDDLALWIGSTNRVTAVTLFTTNYDLLAEQALERNNVPFFDGFVGVGQPFIDAQAIESDELPARWARLWKLHGSANWMLLPDGKVVRQQPDSIEEQRLIHPSHLKYDESRRMPYIVMQDQLRGFLRQQAATLVVVGYSFGDDHINDIIDQGLRGNPTASVFALLHGRIEKSARALSLASANPNITVLARDGGAVAGRTATWQPASDDAAECALGDFAVFGQHLRRLVGRAPAEDGTAVGD